MSKLPEELEELKKKNRDYFHSIMDEETIMTPTVVLRAREELTAAGIILFGHLLTNALRSGDPEMAIEVNVNTYAEELSTSTKTIRRALKKLEEHILVELVDGKGRGVKIKVKVLGPPDWIIQKYGDEEEKRIWKTIKDFQKSQEELPS